MCFLSLGTQSLSHRPCGTPSGSAGCSDQSEAALSLILRPGVGGSAFQRLKANRTLQICSMRQRQRGRETKKSSSRSLLSKIKDKEALAAPKSRGFLLQGPCRNLFHDQSSGLDVTTYDCTREHLLHSTQNSCPRCPGRQRLNQQVWPFPAAVGQLKSSCCRNRKFIALLRAR